MGDYKRVAKKATVRKFYYESNTHGIKLHDMSRNHKEWILEKAEEKAERDLRYKLERELALPRFSGGNDAVLEYLEYVGKDKKKQRPIAVFHANSAVNDSMSPFARIGGVRKRYALIPSTPSLSPIRTNRNRDINDGPLRENDTEYKLLEKVSKCIRDKDEHSLIRMYTDLEPCLSCDYVIIQFTKRYPNITIEVYYKDEYKPEGEGLI